MTLLVIVFAIYFLLLLFLLAGWRMAMTRRLPRAEPPQNQKITVVVPFRNEEQNIHGVILDLIRQTYNHDLTEVVLCDDHSTDDSVTRVTSAISGHGNFTLIHSPHTGKKRALAYAIEQATGEIIVTTDADCRIPEYWLQRISDSFQSPRINMVFGGVRILETRSFFSRLQAMEFASLIGSAAATLNLGFPTMCNGANLAFRKSIFLEVEGYDGNLTIPSGDDEFLMRKIKTRYPGTIYFLNAPDSVVTTQPQRSLNAFVQQRLRWAGKWRYHPSVASAALAIFVQVFQLSYLTLLVRVALAGNPSALVLSFVGVKFLLEGVFLLQVSSLLGTKWWWPGFLILQLLYPVYVIWIGISANFRPYSWKGRKLSHRELRL